MKIGHVRASAVWTLAAIAALASPVAAQSWCTPQRASNGFVALTGVTVWDGTGTAARPGMTILVHGERIVAVGPAGRVSVPAGAAVRDLSGAFVIPGLFESHGHVGSDVSGEDTRERAGRRLCRALLGGITVVRDMAGDTRALASMARDAKVGDIASPDIYFAALWAGPSFFSDPRTAQASAGEVPGSLPGMRAVDSTTDLRQAVAEARGTGATAIKLYADLPAPLVAAATAEAHRQGLLVWAHAAIGPVTPLQVVDAGVDVVSHAPLVARQLGLEQYRALTRDSVAVPPGTFDTPGFDSLMDAMRRRQTIFDPTLFIYGAVRGSLVPVAAAVTVRAHRAGIPLVAGTDSLGVGDAGPWVLPNLHRELWLLVHLGGLTPAEALGAATRNAAMATGSLRDRGTIEPGKLADLLILDADPTADIENTGKIRLVLKRGAFYPGGPTIGDATAP
ncbi:MAG TPA: amidohydrolase family protein [Gemmatimonadales bacterium]|nr:amidohydrolase family protein [Gemmatimonadales bacterium]